MHSADDVLYDMNTTTIGIGHDFDTGLQEAGNLVQQQKSGEGVASLATIIIY